MFTRVSYYKKRSVHGMRAFGALCHNPPAKVRIMNFDRVNRMTASAFAATASADNAATAGCAKTQRAEGKLGRVPRTPNTFGGRTPDRSWGRQSFTLPCQKFGRGGEGAEISRNTGPASVRSLRGQHLLQHKLEKNGISPKIWYWPIFQIGKFELPANKDDPAEIERNWSLKFLQFLENFSGGIPTGGRG